MKASHMNKQKEAQVKLTKGLLDLIILKLLNFQPIHGYQIITKIRKSFGVYFGPSTIYPLLGNLEKKGYVMSEWNMKGERPRKIYKLTNEGQNMLNFTENSLNLICKTMGTKNKSTSINEASEVYLTPVARFSRDSRPVRALAQ
jgi:DNA-binding PadR family transcriptional regulator